MPDPDHGPLAQPPRPAAGIPAQVAASAAMGVLSMQALRLAGMGGTAGGWLAASALYLACCAMILAQMRRSYPHDRIGGCNAVTLLRAAITCALLAPLADGAAAGWAVAMAGLVALALDGVDGWLARRSGLVSGFGARFDMEVDAAFALTLALHVWLGTTLGPEVLLLGVLRYGFVAAGTALPWLRADLPQRLRRKAICVLQLATLLLLQTPLPSHAQAGFLAWLATAALALSFALDIRWLWRHRP
ncbi:CDP-alcohol phosphatidyltransferase family protein [Paracoccus denitrificans]|uniref:CDP-alcohol phosphatidyltransferase family protein n=1 Tax=Paracoccus denitrificans TaxID=266 RepID=UPI001E63DF0E|nr:CDP-alcohol phosphatidyltransferase family protein [Paracoccus denitrificans]UFS66819.1 CDP-alcohol phosphatidyltransferase family protein [Paracoccus denitrificans]